MSLDLACASDFSVETDAIRVRQIVSNLLVNAIKFTTVGKVVLRVDYLPEKQCSSGTLVLEVRDMGMDTSPERQRNIFEPYAHVESPGNRGASGTGLGLSICREFMKLVGGVVTVSSNPEVDTVFTVILPAREAHAEMALPGAAEAAGAPAPHAISSPRAARTPLPESEEGPLVLVADDREAVQHTIQHQPEALVCRPVIAGTGEAALERFAPATFDMMLPDRNLPGIDEHTVAQRIRNIEHQRGGERTLIMAISAVTGDTHRVRCFDSGTDGVLSKPLRLAVLWGLIELWCGHGDFGLHTAQTERETESTVDMLVIY